MDFIIGNGINVGGGITMEFVDSRGPTNISVPILAGTFQVRQTVTTSNGVWDAGVPAPITGYQYQWQASNSNISGQTTSSLTIPYTMVNQPIRCEVTATNSTGSNSAFSINSTFVTPNVSLPPTSVTAVTISATTANVSFTPSADNGGATVTGYIVTSSPDGITASGSGTTITVSGLTTHTTYTFTVQAVNSVGNSIASSPSNSILVVPAIGEFFGGGYYLSDNGPTYTVVGPLANEVTGNGVVVLNAYFGSTINGYTGWDSGTVQNWNDAYTNKAVFAGISQGFANTEYWTGVEVIPFSTDKMYYINMATGVVGQAFKYSQAPYNGPIYRGRPFRTAAW